MLFNLKLLDSSRDISNNILKALLPEVRSYFVDAINNLKINLPPVIKSAIINTPEYASISSGKLQLEFGIPDPQNKLSGLIDIWSTNTNIQYNQPTISSGRIKGSFSINMIKIDFSDVLYSDYAIVFDSFRGYTLPWLEWLLLYGNKTIIRNKSVIIGPNRLSRTGLAIMRDSNKSWKVPSEFAGTISDNWITRAIDAASTEIELTIDKAFDI